MTPARRALLAAVLACPVVLLPSNARAQSLTGPKQVYVFIVPGVSLGELLSSDNVRAIARAGGSGFVSPQLGATDLAYSPRTWRDDNVRIVQLAGPGPGMPRDRWLRRIGDRIRVEVPSTPGDRVLVIVSSPTPSSAMRAANDELRPIVLADVAADRLFHVWRPLRSLTSDSTRRGGIVSDADLEPTILAFLGRSAPAGQAGSVIRVVDGPPPFDLHERYLAMRRMSVPIQTAAGLYVTIAGLFGIALLALGRRAPRALLWTAAWLALSVPALATGLLLAGHLPTLSYATVVPFVIGGTIVGTLAFAPLVRRDVLLPAVAIGAAVLVAFVVEAALGWTAALTPFLGGSELDGGRFYGLPNVFIGLLLGASLYVAVRVPAVAGFGVLLAAGLFAGLPWTGVNIGGALTLFAAAGLWLSVRRSGRIGIRELGLTGVITLAGTVIVLLAHRYLTTSPTHATRFIEEGGGLGHYVRTYADRLLVGWRLIERNPFALVPVLGLPVALIVVLRPPGPIRSALDANPVWRDAVLVALLGGVVAYLANDSGAAAAGLAFGLGLGGLLYVSLAERARKMERS